MNEKTERIYNELLLEKAKAKAKKSKKDSEKCDKDDKKCPKDKCEKDEKGKKGGKGKKSKFPFWMKKKSDKTKDESVDFSYDPMEELEMIAESMFIGEPKEEKSKRQ